MGPELKALMRYSSAAIFVNDDSLKTFYILGLRALLIEI